MYQVVERTVLNPTVIRLRIEAPRVARKAQPGQFIILRVDEAGERIPLTVAGTDPVAGTVSVIFQIVGATTQALSQVQVGDYILDFVGPLGRATQTEGLSRVLVIGGGVGCAIALPVAQKLHAEGVQVRGIIGFRSRELVILEQEFSDCTDALSVMTDDGSYGTAGNVTQPLKALLESGEKYDRIFAIGPLVMMKYVVETARPYGVPVTVSMNPIMIDGTGMCGGCRLSLLVDGRRVTKFACVDGPEFDGYAVDFDEAMSRARMYGDFERHAYEQSCNLFKGVR